MRTLCVEQNIVKLSSMNEQPGKSKKKKTDNRCYKIMSANSHGLKIDQPALGDAQKAAQYVLLLSTTRPD